MTTASQAQLDAAFYEMVHRLHHQAADAADERRGNDRYAYHCVQRIAPYDGRSLPRPEEFVPMSLNDLSYLRVIVVLTAPFSALPPGHLSVIVLVWV